MSADHMGMNEVIECIDLYYDHLNEQLVFTTVVVEHMEYALESDACPY